MRQWIIRVIGVAGPTLLATVFAAAAEGQQPLTQVTLLSAERGLVADKPVATKEIVAHLATRMARQSGLRMVIIQSCPTAPADTLQAVISELQKGRFMPVLDLHEPDPWVCAR